MAPELVAVGSSSAMVKLHHEIFSILESNFLFGPQSSSPSATSHSHGRVCILCIDSDGSTDGLLAAASLARLESTLRRLSGDPNAAVSDFFDLAAGSGAGGLLAALLFSRRPSGRPLLSAAEALAFLAKCRRAGTSTTAGEKSTSTGLFRWLFRKKNASASAGHMFRDIFGAMTVRDAAKPVLIPCYDVATAAPFVFSRADAMESDGYNFTLSEVCAATMGASSGMRSVDGKTVLCPAAVGGGGVAMGNPAAAAITHVLNNKTEFPLASGVEDLFVVSVGNGEAVLAGAAGRRNNYGRKRPGAVTPSPADLVRIAGDGVSDMIDQAVAMAFGQTRTTNYVRIQGREVREMGRNPKSKKDDALSAVRSAEKMLEQMNVDSVLFHGKRVMEKTNGEKLDMAAIELTKEHERRKLCPLPMVTTFKGQNVRRSSGSMFSSGSLSSSGSSSP